MMNPTTQLRVTLAGVIATMLAATTLHPLVDGYSWALSATIVVAIVVGIGVGMRQVTTVWPAVVAVQAVALLVTLTVIFVRDAALLGVLPSPAALNAMGTLLSDGVKVTQETSPPVPGRPGVTMMLVTGVGLVGLAVDVIAVSLQRPAVAGLPLLAVYCVPAAVLPTGLGWQYFMLAALGFLLLVGADANDRIRAWGRVLGSSEGDPSDDRSGGLGGLGGPLSGARRVAAVSIIAAVLIPLLVPGLDERLLTNDDGPGKGKGSGKISVLNPILTLRQDLGARSKDPVIRYTTNVSEPEPLRIVTDDVFDGERWAPSTGPVPRDQRVQDGLSAPPGLTSEVATTANQTDISIGNLKETYLPLPYPSTKVDIKGGWLFETRSLNVVGDGIFTNGISYTAYHLSVEPTSDQLLAAGPAPASISQTYTKLPDQLPAQIRERALEVAGQGTAFEQAIALQDFFRTTGGFTYSEQVSGNGIDDSGQDAVLAFLDGKQGYCVQFASAMAVMARTLGIASRVAVGFLPGTKTADGGYQITLQDAHAWPELYFDGVGWARFEPTPATRAPNAPPYSAPAPSTPEVDPSPSASQSAAPAQGAPSPQAASPDVDSPAEPEKSSANRVLAAIPWQLIGLLVLVVLLALIPALASRITKRRRWAGATTQGQLAEAAWDDLRERLGDLGVGWAASWTPRALQRRLVGEHALGEPESAAAERLVVDVESARYTRPDARPTRSAADVRADVDLLIEGVALTHTARIRQRAQWFPKSGITALGRWVRRADGAAEQVGRRAGELGAQVRRSVGSGRR